MFGKLQGCSLHHFVQSAPKLPRRAHHQDLSAGALVAANASEVTIDRV